MLCYTTPGHSWAHVWHERYYKNKRTFPTPYERVVLEVTDIVVEGVVADLAGQDIQSVINHASAWHCSERGVAFLHGQQLKTTSSVSRTTQPYNRKHGHSIDMHILSS